MHDLGFKHLTLLTFPALASVSMSRSPASGLGFLLAVPPAAPPPCLVNTIMKSSIKDVRAAWATSIRHHGI